MEKQKYKKYKYKYLVAKIIQSTKITDDSELLTNKMCDLMINIQVSNNYSKLDNIDETFKTIYNNINIKDIKKESDNYDIRQHHVLSNKTIFVDNSILKDIETLKVETKCYEYDNDKIIVQSNYDNYINLVKLIFCMKKMVGYTRSCKVGLYGTIHKKMLPIEKKEIRPININSGYTLPQSYSVIFRQEEMNKVAIHEVLHQMRVYLDVEISKEAINKYFKYKKNMEILIDEAYVEFFACIINILYIKEKHKMSKNELNMLYKTELYFSLLQLSKLLIHFGIESYEHFFPECNKLTNGSCNKHCEYNEQYGHCTVKMDDNIVCANDTHPEAYIIIKTAMLYYFDETIEILERNGKNIFNRNENPLNVGIIEQYIIDICGRQEFMKTVNNIIGVIRNIKDVYTKKNCRLTCIEGIID